jgi:hypothetical protein
MTTVPHGFSAQGARLPAAPHFGAWTVCRTSMRSQLDGPKHRVGRWVTSATGTSSPRSPLLLTSTTGYPTCSASGAPTSTPTG